MAVLPVVAALVAIMPPVASAAAGSIMVTNQADSGPGSLREAIADAAPGDTVIVPAGTYLLSSGELVVDRTLTVSGAGAANTIIDAQTASRVIHTTGAGNAITISGVTIRNGRAVPPPLLAQVNGGGLLNDQATVTLSDDVITRNQANADGRAATGAGGGATGGGVFSMGSLNLVDTDVKGNTASAVGNSGQGGGTASAGGVFSSGALSIRGSTFEGNLADARGGQGPLNANQRGGEADGGGIDVVQNGATDISATTFHDNVADASVGPGGVNVGSSGFSDGGGATLNNGSGPISETNVTYARNVARAGAGQSRGGAILFSGDGAGQSLTNATITGNTAGGGVGNRGGDIFVGANDGVTIENTVISAGASDAGSENCGADGALSSLGSNIDSRDQCNFHASGDLVSKDPLLGDLQDNGGPVETAALNPGSPAINAAAAGVCQTTDARGVLRPAGGGCDIGAFEIATPGAATGQASSVATGSTVLNATVSNPDLSPGTALFQYGTTTDYGNSTAAQPINPVTATLIVSARLDGLLPGTTYHFRIVARNANGTVTGADRTFTTTSQGTVPPPPKIAVRSVSIAGASARVRLACEGAAGQRCSGTLLGTVRERLRGHSIVSVDSSARPASGPAAKTKTVIVASGTFKVSAGQAAILPITANATGKQLLLRFYRLPTTIVFAGPNQLSRMITFAYPRVKPRVLNFWTLTLPPCGPCVTMVQQLTVTGLPDRPQVTVSCRGSGCPFARRALTPRRRNVVIAGLFRGSRLQSGTKLEIRITAPNRVGEALSYTIRTGTLPRAATLCLPPGARSPVACRAGS